MKKKLIIIDISNFIFRAFFAIRPLTAPDGTPVNAVHGVLSMLLKIFKTYTPTHVFIARDTKGGSFRNELYDEYKANRSEPPEDLVPQFALIKELQEKMGIPFFEHENFEADDIIGSACVQWKDDFDEIFIASGDKDLMQFVGDNIFMMDTMKDKIYNAEDVFEKMGVHPNQIVDYLSIVGDASDNIPGMRGIGAKGAAKLLYEYKTLESCIDHKDEMKGKRLINAFENHLEDALMSKKLVQIITDIDLERTSGDTKFSFYPTSDLIGFMERLNFKSVIRKLNDMKFNEHQARNLEQEASFVNLSNEKIIHKHTHTLVTKENLTTLLDQVCASSAMAMHTEYTSADLFERRILGISICFNNQDSYYFPFQHEEEGNLSKADLFLLLEKSWGNENIEICSEHSKRDLSHSLAIGLEFKAQRFDITQAHYVANSSLKHDIEILSLEYFDYNLKRIDSKKKTFEEEAREEVVRYAGETSCLILQLSEVLKSELRSKEVEQVYYEMDDLLTPILASIEKEGISINEEYFASFGAELEKNLRDIEKKIYRHCDEEVNLNSPKQVGILLFETLGLPVVKKTKTGFSTDSEVLVELDANYESEVPGLLLKYREVGKLFSTYVNALPQLVNQTSKRIHTSFNQHIAATGRLSSVNPNLQNIPIRSDLGRKVRKGFIPKKNHVFIGADYSQVELRILAHLSKDKTMLKAFKNGIDIHSQTASEVLNIKLEDVNSKDRSKAKAVNFGLMYGQSSFGLAKTLGISRSEAKEYITNYFDRFSKVKGYLDTLKEHAEQHGHSITMFGRKRFLPDIYSKNRTIKANAERVAINSPIQGTAADIIKMAMIQIQAEINEQKLKTKMILQVHDELIFEVPSDEIEIVKNLVRDKMESVVELDVPLTIDMGVADNWYDLK
ncbi:MAG: DNA polymerase I [Bacteriovoracaceae bacterium]|mgnify:CR=1 FL=1|jgi:DNA polymerase I|nr:DNA polymerase I [Bacteriovoracaceae bacterium]